MNPNEKYDKSQEKQSIFNTRPNQDINNVYKTHVVPVEISHNALKMENQI